jgi:hypothetical protein
VLPEAVADVEDHGQEGLRTQRESPFAIHPVR